MNFLRRSRQPVLLGLAALTAGPAAAFTPELERVGPRGGQRGTEMELEFHGKRLEHLEEVVLYGPGLSISSLTSEKPERAVARVAIAPDAPLGEHVLRLRTRRGLTYLRTFWVGPYPTVMEVEPNNTPNEAQRIELGTTVEGVAQSEDVDHFVVAAKKGQRLSVEVEGMRLGRVLFDPYLAVLGPDGEEIADQDDTPLFRQDPFVSFIAPADGDYTILVREAAYEGSGASQYRMHVGTFTRPSAVFPPAALPGSDATFRMIGDPAGDYEFSIRIPEDAGETFSLHPGRDGEVAPGAHPIRVSPLPFANASGENTEHSAATAFPAVPGAVHGIVTAEGPYWFRFSAKKKQNLRVQVHARSLRSPLDSVISVRPEKGNALGNNDDQDGPDSRLDITIPEDGDYFVSIRDHLGRHGPDFFFRIEITAREPILTASLPTAERNNSQKAKVIPVPRGNRYAMMVNVARQNIGCDILFEAASTPEGVRMDADTVARSINAFPVVFEAAADAPVRGSLHAFTVKSTNPEQPASGVLTDTINFIEQNNVGVFHATSLDRIAMAVVEEAPLHIDLEKPSVPIVRNGSLTLKIRARRAEGFTAPVKLRIPWSPPGIGAPVDVTLEEGKSEAEITINANGDAAIASWKICVVAEVPAPEGPVEISTALVPITVAEPYIGLSIEMAATEQALDSAVLAKVQSHREFSGEAKATLVGLPHGVTAEPVSFAHGQEEIRFSLKVAEDAAIGKHTTLFCAVRVPENGGTVLHQVGQGGTLRVDRPRPVASTDTPKPEAGARPLSRLEQLRQSAHP